MTREADHLAALIGSRMCHDLVSPLGAIGNGVELMQMMQPPSPEMDLVSEAVKMAQDRIRLFRLAFGVADDAQTVHAADLVAALCALEGNGRLRVQPDLSGTMPRAAARRLALAALCAESALAWGGDIAVTPTGLSARAHRLRLDPDLWPLLAQGAAPKEPSSATVHFALLAYSGPVTAQYSETALTITL